MMKMIAILSTTTLMVGCSGLNSEFEHSIPAKDSGYWLQQADDMTSTGKDGLVNPQIGSSSYVNVKEYKLINTGNLRLPVKMQGEAEVAQGNVAETNQHHHITVLFVMKSMTITVQRDFAIQSHLLPLES